MQDGYLSLGVTGGLSPRSVLLTLLALVGCLLTNVHAQDAAECTATDIPAVDFNTTSTTSAVSPEDGFWCPETSDSSPYLEMTLTTAAADKWALREVVIGAAQNNSFRGYASTYSLNYTRSQDVWDTLSENQDAVRMNSTHTRYRTITYSPPVTFRGVRIIPTESLNGSGRCMKVTLRGCLAADLCPVGSCGSNGRCVGENLCACDDGFFGAACSMTAKTLLQAILRLGWVVLANNQVNTEAGQFNSSWSSALTTSGFALQGNRMTIQGTRSYLFSSSLQGPFGCLLNPDSYSSVYVSFTYSLGSLAASETGLFGTDPMQKWKGVSAWISTTAGGSHVLRVEVRRRQRLWTVSSSIAATEFLNKWTKLEISWDVANGLVVFVNGEETDRCPSSFPASENQESNYFVIGYPSYDYAVSYNVSLVVRDFTVSPVSRRQTKRALRALCPLGCLNSGLCRDQFSCSCDDGYFGPLCMYTESGSSLSVLSSTSDALSTTLGSLTINTSSSGNVTLVSNGFRLEGLNTYLSIESPAAPFNGLVFTETYSSFTVAVRFSVSLFNEATYVMCTDYPAAAKQGVNLVLTKTQLLVLQVNLMASQWTVQYQFDGQEWLRAGVLVEFSFSSSALVLYVNEKEVARSVSASSTRSLPNLFRPLVFGRPNQDYSGDLQCGLTVYELSMWPKSRDEIVKVESIEQVVEPVKLPPKPTDTTNNETTTATTTLTPPAGNSSVSDNTTTTGPQGNSTNYGGCDGTAFVGWEKALVNLTISLLSTEAVGRSAGCMSLENMTLEAEVALETCWRTAEDSQDSTSVAAYLKYTHSGHLTAFKTIKTRVCEGTFSAATSSECNLSGIMFDLLHFYDLALQYGQGLDSCSLLWMSHERLSAKLTMCDEDTRSVLSKLSMEVSRLSSMACSPSTCNLDYSMTCVGSAQRLIAATTGLTASDQQCRDLKLSLACATNHTVDCNGATYNLLFEQVDHVRARYRQACKVEEPEPTCTGRLSKKDAQKMLQLSAYGKVLPTPVLCGLWGRKEWVVEEAKSSLPSFAASVLEEACSDMEMENTLMTAASCVCNESAVRSLSGFAARLTRAGLTGSGAGICDEVETGILAVFDQLTGCQESVKTGAVAVVNTAFSTVCSRQLTGGRLVCASKCDIAACQGDVCGDVSQCLAQNALACDPMQVFEAVATMQAVRDSDQCSLAEDTPVIQLPNQPKLTGVLMCLRPITAQLSVSAVPVGEYCNAMATLQECLEEVEGDEEEDDDELRKLALEYTKGLVGMVDSTACSFMPDTACGSGTKADVVFVLDASSSIGAQDFSLLLTFVKNLLNEWNVGEDEIRIGVVKFSNVTEIEFQLNTHEDKDDVLSAVQAIMYRGGTTDTASGLLTMKNEMFTAANGDRENVPRFGIVITDGKSTDDVATKKAAREVRAAGITLLSVGVGDGVDNDELVAIASPPRAKHVFNVANYSQLAAIQSQFMKQTCAVISDFVQPYKPSGEACPTMNETIQQVEKLFLAAVRFPLNSLKTRKDICSNLPEPKDWSDCGRSERDYLDKLFESVSATFRRMCRRQEAEEGCDVAAATGCLQELAKAFVLPGVSACSVYPKVEVCVQHNTAGCPATGAWPHMLKQFKALAESTCCKGSCDPAEAVLCLMDVQHMAKSQKPDWEGICSELDGSLECAARNVAGCDKCQRDTIKVISGKVSAQLAHTCRDPPETKCRAMSATKCKETLLEFSMEAAETTDSRLCLKVFEARKCMRDLTDECDEGTKLALSVGLETAVASLGGESCRQETILPVCYGTLVARVQTILAFDPLDPSDPAYKYTPPASKVKDTADKDTKDKDTKDKDTKDKDTKDKDTKDKDTKDKDTKDKDTEDKDTKDKDTKDKDTKDKDTKDKDTKDKDTKDKDTKDKDTKDKDSKDKDSKDKDSKDSDSKDKDSKDSDSKDKDKSVEIVDFPTNYLGVLCTEAQLAYACVKDSLKQFPTTSVTGLDDVISTTWSLAWLRCKAILEPVSCYTCEDSTDNGECNRNAAEECGTDLQMCRTQVETDGDGAVLSVNKGCVVPYECKPGCKDGVCTFCCDTEGCNLPDDGPLTGTCSLTEVSACLSELSATILKSDSVNCSFVHEKEACIDYSRAQCEANGERAVSEVLSGFLSSSTVAECRVELSDSRCGLYAVSALGSFLSSFSLLPDEFDFCPLLLAVERERTAAVKSEDCTDEETTAVTTSLDLFRSQLWSVDCGVTITPVPVCDPIGALTQCLIPEDGCSFGKNLECISNYTRGCQPVQRLAAYSMLRILAAQSSCNPATLTVIPSMPEELQPLDMCLSGFSINFTAALAEGLDVSVSVDGLLVCLLMTWDVETILMQPPAYKLYLTEMIVFLRDVLLPAVQALDTQVNVTVTAECKAKFTGASLSFAGEVLLLLMRPFGSFGEPSAFCHTIKGFEASVSAKLSSCTDAEKGSRLQLWTSLQEYRMTLCPDLDTAPQCSVKSATQCLQRFTALMDTVTAEEEQICGFLNTTLSCVKTFTSDCPAAESEEVSRGVYQVIGVYQVTCPQVVSASVCSVANQTGLVVSACSVDTAVLDQCDVSRLSLSCESVAKAVNCYRKEVGNCVSASAAIYSARFMRAFPVHAAFAMSYCGLDLSTWTFDGEVCTAPTCDVEAAAKCFQVSNITLPNVALLQGPMRITDAAKCLEEKLAGCDVLVRAQTVLVIRHKVEIFLQFFPALRDLELKVTFSDPFGMLVPLITRYMEQINLAFTSPQWDLLPLCWWLHDLSNDLDLFLEGNSFLTSVFGRGAKGLKDSMAGVCNDPEIIGVILNLPESENASCPATDARQGLTNAVFEAVFTGILQQESRSQLCKLLEDVDEMDLDDCSSGLQRQVKLLSAVVQRLAGKVCEMPQYCSVKMVQRCVVDLVTTVQGLGSQISTQQVCSSVTALDTCVRRFSFRCDDSSRIRIKTSVRSVRRMAISVCGEMMPEEALPSCVKEEEKGRCRATDARDCSVNQFLDLLSTFADDGTQCRSLQFTQDCYNRVTKSCASSDSNLKMISRLPEASLTALRDRWGCVEQTEESPEVPMCSEGCQLEKAEECITTLSASLQFWGLRDGDACSVVTAARQCLTEQTRDCSSKVLGDFQTHLKSVLSIYSTLTAQCVDVYSCLADFAAIGRQILSKDDALEPSDSKDTSDKDSKDKDTKDKDTKDKDTKDKDTKDKDTKDKDTKDKDTADKDTKDKDTADKDTKDKDTKDKDTKDEDTSDSNLFVLCQQVRKAWECAERGLDRLPRMQRKLLTRIFGPLWSVLSDRCSNTVQLQCYKCSNVLWEESEDVCTDETEVCRHNEQSCSSQYKTEGDQVYVTRGCMKPAHCHAKDKKDNTVSCCYTENCNIDAVFQPAPDVSSDCFVEYAVDCAFNFAESLVQRGSVECSTSLDSLQCVARYSEGCPAAKTLFTAANQLMLTLAQTTCVQGSLSEGCRSIAVPSMEAILTNAYSAESACSGLKEASMSVDLLETKGECTTLDLVALRESLSFASVITHTSCYPDDCQTPAAAKPTTPEPEEVEDEKACDFFATSLCGRKALDIFADLNATNKEEICREVDESAKCAVKNLQGCDVTPCLQGLIDRVKQKALDSCAVDYLAPPPDAGQSGDQEPDEECRPAVICDLDAAFTCVDLLAESQNDTELCRRLNNAAECRRENVMSCRSLQSALTTAYFKNTLGDAMETCTNTTQVDLTAPTDVYANSASCVTDFMEQMSAALMADNLAGPVCQAAQAFRDCPKELPELTLDFIIGDMMDMVEAIAPDDLCNNTDGAGRRTREAETGACSKGERSGGVMVVTMSNFFSTVPLNSRSGLCMRLSKALDVLAHHLSNTSCSSVGLSEQSRQVLQSLLQHGSAQFDSYCVAVRYELAGCKPDLFPTCLSSFSSVSSFAKTQSETQCRAAESAMECLKKFSKGCSASAEKAASAVRDQVRAVVGNTCPNLTLGLFCPGKFSSLRNNFTCSFRSALDCLPSAADIGGLQRVTPDYCSELKSKLECASRGLQGCLQNQVANATVKVTAVSSLRTETTYCSIDTNVTDYSSACVAREPCSVSAALACMKVEKDANLSDCSVLGNIRTCMDTAVASCSNDTEAVNLAYDLFLYRFAVGAPSACIAPFADILSTENVSPTYTCTNKFLENLRNSLETTRTMSSVCQAFDTYVTCMTEKAADSANLANILNPATGFITDVRGLFCQTGGVNASGASVSALCELRSASFCLAKELSWTLNRHFLPNSDNQKFCQGWNQQSTRSCVTQHTSQCDADIQSLVDDVSDMSTRLILASGACDSLSTCFMQEAYYHINQFSVAVSTYTIDKDVNKLCVKKLEMETDVESFTATCKASQRAMVATSLSRVTDLVEDVCEDIDLPAPPICPNLPVEQQRCNIGAAFSCIIAFNTHLLSQGPSLIWRDWCTSLEHTIRCAAFNTSSCDRDESSVQSVMNALDALREEAGYRCPWLTPDLCTRNTPCPAQDAGCDVDLQVNLLNRPLDNVCTFIQQAKECVTTNTITCSRAQVMVADKSITRRLGDLSIPTLTCNGSEVAPCLLRGRAASWQILTKPSGGNRSTACSVMTEATQCLNTRVGSNATQQQQVAKALAAQLQVAVQGWCTTAGTCGDALALVMNAVYDWTIHLATAASFDKSSFCSTRQAVLADIAVTKELYSATCSLTDLDGLVTLLTGQTGYAALCGTDAGTGCSSAIAAARQCLINFDADNACSSVNSVLACLAPAVGQCNSSDSTPLLGQFKTLLATNTTCTRPPIIGLSTSTTTPLYLSEQGGTIALSFQLAEEFSDYTSGGSARQVRIRAQVANTEPPTCLGDTSAEISQLSVLYENGELCGVRLAGSDDSWDGKHTIHLVANQDGRQDGMQQAIVSLYADVYDYVAASDSWLRGNESFKLAEYQVNIEDTDMASAVCSSIGDPHTQTFDGTLFNNNEAGEFLLYRNSIGATAVTVSYQQCAVAATCTCAVEVQMPNTSVRFDRCRRVGATGAPEDITVTMPESGAQSVLSVYRHSDLQTYYVVLPTGTIVTVKASGRFLNVWITASSLDFGKTEGLCGLFDGDAYNDLILPSGERYVTKKGDVQYGVLSPTDFINQWKTSQLSQVLNGTAKVTTAPSCSCLDSNPIADQCGALASVTTCDHVQGEDITSLLVAAASQTSGGFRRRRAVEDSIDYSTTTTPQANVGWPTPSNWTEARAQEYCERQLENVLKLRYCDKAVLTANGTYSYTDAITMCVENIRLSDSVAYVNSSTLQAVEKCRSLFLRNTTYQNTDAVRHVVMEFLHRTCTKNCHGKGDCQMGVCYCYPGYVGGDCSYLRTDLPRPSATAVMHDGLCQVSAADRCEDIFITGHDLIDSAYLSCHIQSVKVTSSGQHSPVGQASKVPATLITASLAHCRLSRSDAAHQTVTVAISNDGVSPGEAMFFTAHDPRCYACNPATHHCSHGASDTCEIQGRCYMAQETSSADNCLVCNPAVAPNNWSHKDSTECEVSASPRAEDDFSPLLAGIIASVLGLVAITAIVAVACIIKKRQARKTVGGDQEFGHSRPQAHFNPGYSSREDVQPSTSKDSEPQEPFSHGSIHKRAVTQMTSNTPTTPQGVMY
ncbi:uncharacterized protein [Littorina saxatilis]|uniref:uncharacterized protein isoform X2 n=1 Tax=Littorina saxatilis TaxID=31220 RepID=UPI0038B49387